MYKLIGTMSVKRLTDGACIPLVDGNIDYEEYKQWLVDGNIPEPEFTEEELAKQESDRQIAESKTYLASTDFYMTVDKYVELDEAIKVELTTKRAEARELINTLEAELVTIGAK